MKMYFFVLYFFISATGYSNEFPVVSRLKKEKVRAVSCALGNANKVQKFKSGGFNLALTWSYILKGAKPNTEGSDLVCKTKLPRLKAIEHEANLAKKHNIISMPLIWFHNDTLPFIQGKVRKCVTANGKQSKVTPCPQDEVYWQKLMKPLVCAIAEIQKKVGCDGGVALELEFYTGDFIGGYRYGRGADGCYCDHCFYGFLKKNKNSARNIPLNERYYYVTKNYGLKRYLQYLGHQTSLHIKEICNDARKIKEDFLLGVLLEGKINDKYRWYASNIIEAASTKQNPVLVFSLNEYYTGYNHHSEQNMKILKDKKINAFYIGGLTISNFNAEGIGCKSAELVQKNGGFWLYYGEILFLKKPKIIPHDPGTNEWVLRENPERYFECMKKAMNWVNENPEYKPEQSKRSISLLKKDFFPNAKDFKVNNNCFINCKAKRQTAKIANSDFFPNPKVAWNIPETCNISTKIKKSSPLCIRFSKFKKGGKIWQEVKVRKNSKMRFSMEIRSQNLCQPDLAFALLNAYNNKTYIYRPYYNTDKRWVYYGVSFRPDCDKISVAILSHSLSGKLFVRNVKLEELKKITIKSIPIESKHLSGLKMKLPKNMRCDILNPETLLAYFKISEGLNDLSYLQKIYDESPIVFQFKGEIAVNSPKIAIYKSKLYYSK